MRYCRSGSKITIINLGLYLSDFGGEAEAVFREKFLMPIYSEYDDDHQDDWMDAYMQDFESMFNWNNPNCLKKFWGQFDYNWCDPDRSEALSSLQNKIMKCEEKD